jgi:uncharacterized membrane protein
VSPEEKRAEAIFQAAVEISRFSGPLPHPEDLAKYEQVLPGAADRIIRMAEQQAAHRQNLERAVIVLTSQCRSGVLAARLFWQ